MSQKRQVCIRKCLSWWVNYLSELPKFVAGGYALIYSSACPSIPIAWLSVPMLANTAIKLFLPQLALLVPQGGILYHYCVLFLNMYLGNFLKKHVRNLLAASHRFFFWATLQYWWTKIHLVFPHCISPKQRGVFAHGSFHSTWRLQCTKITTPNSWFSFSSALVPSCHNREASGEAGVPLSMTMILSVDLPICWTALLL